MDEHLYKNTTSPTTEKDEGHFRAQHLTIYRDGPLVDLLGLARAHYPVRIMTMAIQCAPITVLKRLNSEQSWLHHYLGGADK